MTPDGLQTAAAIIAERSPETEALIQDNPSYYAPGAYAARVNITLLEAAASEDRIAFASWLVGRELTSTKELRLAEAIAIINSKPFLPKLYEAFIHDRQLA